MRGDKHSTVQKFHYEHGFLLPLILARFPRISRPAFARNHKEKQKRTGPESRADALGEGDVVLIEWLPVF
jgi:hypothetical protein